MGTCVPLTQIGWLGAVCLGSTPGSLFAVWRQLLVLSPACLRCGDNFWLSDRCAWPLPLCLCLFAPPSSLLPPVLSDSSTDERWITIGFVLPMSSSPAVCRYVKKKLRTPAASNRMAGGGRNGHHARQSFADLQVGVSASLFEDAAGESSDAETASRYNM